MKKYKLVREYPNSPELGTIATYNGNEWLTIELNSKHDFEININDIKEPQGVIFWQEIVEKDYEIISFKNNICGDWLLQLDGEYKFSNTCIRSLEFMLASDSNHIHSVKRLSDNEIFTIGERCTYGSQGIKIIRSFGCVMNTIVIDGCQCSLEHLKHIKDPLYVTEDGVDIYENTDFTYVNISIWKRQAANSNTKYYFNPDVHKLFSSKEKAQEYITMYKPQFSLRDILDIYFGNGNFEDKIKHKARN